MREISIVEYNIGQVNALDTTAIGTIDSYAKYLLQDTLKLSNDRDRGATHGLITMVGQRGQWFNHSNSSIGLPALAIAIKHK